MKLSGKLKGKQAASRSARPLWALLLGFFALVGLSVFVIAQRLPAKVISVVNVPQPFRVHLLTPGDEHTVELERGASFTLTPPAEMEHYRFLGWRSEDGRLLYNETLTPDRDLYFAAEYAVVLSADAELPLLFCDEKAHYRPLEPLTRAECAELLASLLTAPVTRGEGFSDLDADNACTEAAEKLQALGVVKGPRFEPDNTLSRAEYLSMLARFYPAAQGTYRFSDLNSDNKSYPAFCLAAEQGWIESGETVAARPDETLTRADAAIILNRLLGRSYQPGDYYITDLAEDDPLYAEIVMAAGAQALIPPVFPDDVLDEVALDELEPGLHLHGVLLFCVTEDHELLRNGSFDGFSFNNLGHYTSGDEELDALLQPVLQKCCDGKETREEMLRAIYDYLMDTILYRKGGLRDFGDNSWSIEEARELFTTWHGNCYSYAAAFCELSRAIGYPTVVYSGQMGTPPRPHGWAEIEIKGVTYIFDPENEAVKRQFLNEYVDMYMLGPIAANRWNYLR